MATPTLRALRQLYPQTQITCLVKKYIRPVVEELPWHDRLLIPRTPGERPKGRLPRLSLLERLRRKRFDMAVLLPNSFRSALLVYTAGIARRVGYDRDGRSLLLTDRLLPLKDQGRYLPVPAIDYYLGIARYLGAPSPGRRMQLFTRPEDDALADHLLERCGVHGQGPIVLLNPGAATKGQAKLWPADRFAALADALVEQFGAQVLINGSPKERLILDAVLRSAKHRLVDLLKAGGNLRLLKSLCRRCRLVVTNDTGARHIAAAMGTPVISLFGPTDPCWTWLDDERERLIRSPDGRMESIALEPVLQAAKEALQPAVQDVVVF